MLKSVIIKTLLFWITLGLITTSLITQLDLSSLRQHQKGLAQAMEQSLQASLTREEALLAHVASLEQRYRFQPEHLKEHFQDLFTLSGPVQHIQQLQSVDEQQIDAFEQQMRQRHPDFQLHGLSPMTPANLDSHGVIVYHPVIVSTAAAHAAPPPLLGTDLSLSPAHRDAILAASESSGIHYSEVYQPERHAPMLSLYLASPDRNGTLLALALSVPKLLDTRDLPTGSRVTLMLNEQSIPLLHPPRSKPYPLLTLSRENAFSAGQHDWVLQFDYPVFWQQLSWGIHLLALTLNSLGSLLFFAWLRQREATTSCRVESLEVRQLQQHLQNKTYALQSQLRENQHLTHRILDIQERERRHLAQELHDELGQCLTAIRTDARMLLQDHPDSRSEVHQHADNIDSIASHIYDVTYDLMRALRPTLLDDLGLVDAVRELAQSGHLERRGMRVDLELKGALNEMDERYNITLYRLIQEALTNVQRHANCQQVHIRLVRLDDDSLNDRVELDIRDDGCGFDPEDQRHNRRFGLLGMQARVRALHGEFKIDSQKGVGTCLSIRMPLVAAEARDAARPSAAAPAAPRPLDANRQPA